MSDQKKNNRCVCPHCGVDNNRGADVWLNAMSDEDSALGFNGKKTMDGDQSPGSSNDEKTADRHFNIRFFIIAVLLLGLLIYLNRTFDVFNFQSDAGSIIYEILIVFLISATIASGNIWLKFKYLGIWAGIFLIMMTGYSYRHELSGVQERVLSEFFPAKGFQNSPQSISFPISSDGHFYIIAEINGIPIMFLADTGASHIVLSPSDAEKLGIEPDKLDYDRYYETANGTVRGSSIRIADFKVGEIRLKEIGASVNEAEIRNSLLGMTFFKRLQSYEVKEDVLTLHWNR